MSETGEMVRVNAKTGPTPTTEFELALADLAEYGACIVTNALDSA